MEPSMRCTILLVSQLALAVCETQPTAAQDPPLHKGARIRATVPGGSRKPIVGIVDSVSQGVVVLSMDRAYSTTRIPLAQVSKLEVSRRRTRPMWSKTAPLWLTASLGGAGALIGYATTPEDDFFGPGFGALVVGGLGGAIGLLVGTGLAFGVKTDVWESVIPAGSPRAALAPSIYVSPGSKGVRLGMRAAF
jgi:hypothetical protein